MLGLVQYFRGAAQYGSARLSARAAEALTGDADKGEMLLQDFLESADPVTPTMLERSHWTKSGVFHRSVVGAKLRMIADRIIGGLDERLAHETAGRQIARAVGLAAKRNAHLVKLFVFIADALKRVNDADTPQAKALKLKELRDLLTDIEVQCLSSRDNTTGDQTSDFALAMRELNRDLDDVSAAIELETEQASVTDHVDSLTFSLRGLGQTALPVAAFAVSGVEIDRSAVSDLTFMRGTGSADSSGLVAWCKSSPVGALLLSVADEPVFRRAMAGEGVPYPDGEVPMIPYSHLFGSRLLLRGMSRGQPVDVAREEQRSVSRGGRRDLVLRITDKAAGDMSDHADSAVVVHHSAPEIVPAAALGPLAAVLESPQDLIGADAGASLLSVLRQFDAKYVGETTARERIGADDGGRRLHQLSGSANRLAGHYREVLDASRDLAVAIQTMTQYATSAKFLADMGLVGPGGINAAGIELARLILFAAIESVQATAERLVGQLEALSDGAMDCVVALPAAKLGDYFRGIKNPRDVLIRNAGLARARAAGLRTELEAITGTIADIHRRTARLQDPHAVAEAVGGMSAAGLGALELSAKYAPGSPLFGALREHAPVLEAVRERCEMLKTSPSDHVRAALAGVIGRRALGFTDPSSVPAAAALTDGEAAVVGTHTTGTGLVAQLEGLLLKIRSGDAKAVMAAAQKTLDDMAVVDGQPGFNAALATAQRALEASRVSLDTAAKGAAASAAAAAGGGSSSSSTSLEALKGALTALKAAAEGLPGATAALGATTDSGSAGVAAFEGWAPRGVQRFATVSRIPESGGAETKAWHDRAVRYPAWLTFPAGAARPNALDLAVVDPTDSGTSYHVRMALKAWGQNIVTATRAAYLRSDGSSRTANERLGSGMDLAAAVAACDTAGVHTRTYQALHAELAKSGCIVTKVGGVPRVQVRDVRKLSVVLGGNPAQRPASINAFAVRHGELLADPLVINAMRAHACANGDVATAVASLVDLVSKEPRIQGMLRDWARLAAMPAHVQYGDLLKLHARIKESDLHAPGTLGARFEGAIRAVQTAAADVDFSTLDALVEARGAVLAHKGSADFNLAGTTSGDGNCGINATAQALASWALHFTDVAIPKDYDSYFAQLGAFCGLPFRDLKAFRDWLQTEAGYSDPDTQAGILVQRLLAPGLLRMGVRTYSLPAATYAQTDEAESDLLDLRGAIDKGQPMSRLRDMVAAEGLAAAVRGKSVADLLGSGHIPAGANTVVEALGRLLDTSKPNRAERVRLNNIKVALAALDKREAEADVRSILTAVGEQAAAEASSFGSAVSREDALKWVTDQLALSGAEAVPEERRAKLEALQALLAAIPAVADIDVAKLLGAGDIVRFADASAWIDQKLAGSTIKAVIDHVAEEMHDELIRSLGADCPYVDRLLAELDATEPEAEEEALAQFARHWALYRGWFDGGIYREAGTHLMQLARGGSDVGRWTDVEVMSGALCGVPVALHVGRGPAVGQASAGMGRLMVVAGEGGIQSDDIAACQRFFPQGTKRRIPAAVLGLRGEPAVRDVFVMQALPAHTTRAEGWPTLMTSPADMTGADVEREKAALSGKLVSYAGTRLARSQRQNGVCFTVNNPSGHHFDMVGRLEGDAYSSAVSYQPPRTVSASSTSVSSFAAKGVGSAHAPAVVGKPAYGKKLDIGSLHTAMQSYRDTGRNGSCSNSCLDFWASPQGHPERFSWGNVIMMMHGAMGYKFRPSSLRCKIWDNLAEQGLVKVHARTDASDGWWVSSSNSFAAMQAAQVEAVCRSLMGDKVYEAAESVPTAHPNARLVISLVSAAIEASRQPLGTWFGGHAPDDPVMETAAKRLDSLVDTLSGINFENDAEVGASLQGMRTALATALNKTPVRPVADDASSEIGRSRSESVVSVASTVVTDTAGTAERSALAFNPLAVAVNKTTGTEFGKWWRGGGTALATALYDTLDAGDPGVAAASPSLAKL